MNPLENISSIVPNPPPTMKDVTHLSLNDRSRLWQAAKDLESTFSSYLLQDLKFGATEGPEKQSFAADTYGDMFKRTLSDQLARSGSIGLAKQIYMDSARIAEKSMLASTKHPDNDKFKPPSQSPSIPLVPLTPSNTPIQPNHSA